MGRSGVSSALIASILKHLGQKAPSDDQLQDAMSKALAEVKQQEGHDPDRVKYKVAVPIEVDWIKRF